MADQDTATTPGFIEALYRVAQQQPERGQHVGEGVMAWYIAQHLESLYRDGSIPEYGPRTGITILQHLVKYLDDAWEHLRTADSERAQHFRMEFKVQTGHDVPCLTVLEGDNLHRTMIIRALASMVHRITGADWLRTQIEQYFRASETVLRQQFQQFLREVYRQGFRTILDTSGSPGFSATFTDTTVYAFVTGGRVMLTFRRVGREEQVTFVGAENDTDATFGIQSVDGELCTALGMIHDVIARWPSDEDDQRAALREDENVMFG